MSVYIYEPDAFDKMVLVEGGEYRKYGTRNHMGDASFEAFLELWLKRWTENPWFPSRRPRYVIQIDSCSVSIYGFWGWNRYLVYNTGEIVLHEFFAEKSDIIEAEKAGFNIWPDCSKK